MSDSDLKWLCQVCGNENTGDFCCECGVKKPKNADISIPPEPSVNNNFLSDNIIDHLFAGTPQMPAFGMMSEPYFMTLYKTRKDNKYLIKSRCNCGCYTCCNIFDPKEITQWVDEKYAVCPYCNSPTIVGDAAYDSVDLSVLDKLNKYYIKKECVDGYKPSGHSCDDSPWICPKCNSEVKGGLYCFTCGTRNPGAVADIPDTEEEPQTWVCHKCGAQVKGSAFCHECGSKKSD